MHRSTATQAAGGRRDRGRAKEKRRKTTETRRTRRTRDRENRNQKEWEPRRARSRKKWGCPKPRRAGSSLFCFSLCPFLFLSVVRSTLPPAADDRAAGRHGRATAPERPPSGRSRRR